jgi:hypothetical protein
MDQSFNDKELSDIMKEIEALEQDYASGPEQKVSPVIEELVELDEDKAVPTSTENVLSWEAKKTETEVIEEEEVVSSSWESTPIKSENTTSMSFKVQGNLALEMKFDIGGKVVSLEVTQSGLTIELEGGMKFSVPVSGPEEYKKAV